MTGMNQPIFWRLPGAFNSGDLNKLYDFPASAGIRLPVEIDMNGESRIFQTEIGVTWQQPEIIGGAVDVYKPATTTHAFPGVSPGDFALGLEGICLILLTLNENDNAGDEHH